MLKIALVGVGGISGAHIPAWDSMEDVELGAICDIRPERMEKYPDKRHYTDFDEMLEKEEIDILDICLPTYLHADFAVKAMDRGINVISEKPISLHIEDVKRVYGAAERNHVKFMVAQVVRFWPEYLAVKEIYDTGRYGKLLSGSMRRMGTCPRWSWDNWMKDVNRSGLVPYDLHVHDLDFMLYAFGKPNSFKSNRAKHNEQDYIHVTYEYDNFFISAETAWFACDYGFPFQTGFRFQFEDALVEGSSTELVIYEKDGKIIRPGAENVEDRGDTGSINLPKSNAYADEIRYFADCVEQDKDPKEKIKPEELETVINILNNL